MYNRSINPCQPSDEASCSLCCGSHNYKLPPEKIEEIFSNRGQNHNKSNLKDPETSEHSKLFQDALQCPHVGIKPYDNSKLSCLIYDEHIMESKLKSFFKGTCKYFQCPAWENLTDEQVIFAAELMKDWYYYSLFINDIESLQELHATYQFAENVPLYELDILKEELEEKFIEEDGK